MMLRRHLLALPAGFAIATLPAHAANGAMDPDLRRRTVRAIAGGLHYLRGQQAPDGSLLKSVGITALALRGFLESPEKYNEADGAFVTRQVEFLLAYRLGRQQVAQAVDGQRGHGGVGLGLGDRRVRGSQVRLQGAWVDAEQGHARLHLAAFREQALLQDAFDARPEPRR